jgi:phosphoglycolate phosphatase-like HAD superfamily hydrolase
VIKKAAIIDYDGTLTRVRYGWEVKMKEFFLKKICANRTLSQEELTKAKELTAQWVDHAQGTTINQQMTALSEILNYFNFKHQLEILIDEFDKYSTEWEYSRMHELKEKGEIDSLFLNGAIDFLKNLQNEGYELHMLSGTSHEKLIYECEVLGLSNYFIHIQGYATHLASPYKLESMRSTIAQFNYAPKHTLIIGDGLTELKAGRELGCKCLAIAIDEHTGNTPDINKQKLQKKNGFDDSLTCLSQLSAVF